MKTKTIHPIKKIFFIGEAKYMIYINFLFCDNDNFILFNLFEI